MDKDSQKYRIVPNVGEEPYLVVTVFIIVALFGSIPIAIN